MSIPNKFSSHLPSPTSKKDPTIEVKEDNTLREAENMLASPLRQDQPIASPKEEEIERMINSQSLSVVFQDLNDEQLAKFNKKSLDAIAEAQWAENRGALSSDRHQNFDVPLNERKEGLQNKSMASQLTEEKKREHMKTDGNIRAQANTPHKKPSISNKLDLKLKAPMSKNNSPISHSDRSHLKLANEGNGQQRDSLNKSQVKKDKLFSEEDPYVNSKEYQIGDGVDNSKNDWSYNATKPGIDRSEFYNPNNDDLPHNQSILNQNNAGKIIKQPLALRNTGDRFQNEIDNRETGYGETHNFQTKHADQEIRELEDLKQTKFELPPNNSDKKLYSYNHPNNFKSNQARGYQEPTYEDVYNSNEDIDHEEGTPHKSQVVQNTATKRHDSITKSIGRSSEEKKKDEGMKSSGSRKNLFKGGPSCDSFATSNDDKSQSLQKMSRNSATNMKSLLKSKKNILNDLPFNWMQMVWHHLNINSMWKLACTNKKMLEKVKEQSDIWNIKVFKRSTIKMGYEYIRKENLLRIDNELRHLHKEALRALLDGKWKQKLWIIIWFLFFLFMSLLVFPVLLIIDEEIVDIPLGLIFLPFTLSWILLIWATIYLFFIAKGVRRKIKTELWTILRYKFLPKVKGRKFRHPIFWPYSLYLSKALFLKCLFTILIYPGILIKTTIIMDISYMTMILLCWIPVGLLIWFKQLDSIFSSIRHKTDCSRRIRPTLMKNLKNSLKGEIDFASLNTLREQEEDGDIAPPVTNPRKIKYKDTRRYWWLTRRKYYFSTGAEFKIKQDRCSDSGLLHAIILPNLLIGGFLSLWALRLDEVINLNWFIITIPTWIVILPIAILTILHGITSQNRNVTLFEKIVISSWVPIGFLATYILALCRLQEYISLSLGIIFIPNFVAVIAFYLYTRQLKTVKIVPKKEVNQEEEDQDEVEEVEVNE